MNEILYNELLRLAKSKKLASYSEVAPLLDLSMEIEEHREEMAKLLGEIVYHEHANNRPMLTSLVVHKGNDNNPGEGFFLIATELGYFDGSRDSIARLTFWANQVTNVHNHWSIA